MREKGQEGLVKLLNVVVKDLCSYPAARLIIPVPLSIRLKVSIHSQASWEVAVFIDSSFRSIGPG